MITNDVDKVLFSEEEIRNKISELGKQITKDYQGKNLILISVLKGSFVFVADLARAIDLPLKIDFLSVSSYGRGTTSSGEVKIIKDIDNDLSGCDILMVEDILDSGNTLSFLRDLMMLRNPNSFRIVTFLDKPERRTANVEADYVGFKVPDEFIIGYGLDYAETYRNLPFVGVLKREVYENK